MGKKPKRKSAWVHDPEKVAAAERTLRQAKSLLRDPSRLIRHHMEMAFGALGRVQVCV